MDLTLNADQRDLQAGLRRYLRDAWPAERLRAAADAPASTARTGSASPSSGSSA